MDYIKQDIAKLLMNKLKSEIPISLTLEEILNDKTYQKEIERINERINYYTREKAKSNFNKLILAAKLAKQLRHAPKDGWNTLEDLYRYEIRHYSTLVESLHKYFKQLIAINVVRSVNADV
jgi:hypothetical protein